MRGARHFLDAEQPESASKCGLIVATPDTRRQRAKNFCVPSADNYVVRIEGFY